MEGIFALQRKIMGDAGAPAEKADAKAPRKPPRRKADGGTREERRLNEAERQLKKTKMLLSRV